jgi:hypothetical protein
MVGRIASAIRENVSTLFVRFSAGLENPGLKSLRENREETADLSTALCFVSGHDFSRATTGQNG